MYKRKEQEMSINFGQGKKSKQVGDLHAVEKNKMNKSVIPRILRY
jgi:hypothetical protein